MKQNEIFLLLSLSVRSVHLRFSTLLGRDLDSLSLSLSLSSSVLNVRKMVSLRKERDRDCTLTSRARDRIIALLYRDLPDRHLSAYGLAERT